MLKQNLVLFYGILAFLLMQNALIEAVSVEEFLSLTTSEKAALDKFRARVEPLLKDDHMKHDVYLIRWMRSKNFDVNAAEKMFRDSLKWRHGEKIDNIHLEDFSDMAADYHVTVDTYDKTGRPIGVIDMFDWDIRKAVLQGKGQRLLRFVIHFVENITNQVVERQERGMNVTQMVILMNAEGTNVVQQGCPLCLPLWIQLVQTIDKYYPSYMDQFIIIDAPPAVNVLFETVKSFFSRDARGIYHIFDHNKSKWMEYLDARISRDQRREKYGGTKPPFKY